MEASTTFQKFSFLRFIVSYLVLPCMVLFASGWMGVYGQSPTYATWTPNSGVIPRGLLGAGAAGVTNPLFAANDLETQWAQLRAQQVAVLVPVSGGGAYIQLKFEEELAPGTTTFIKISDLDATGISLGVLGLLGLDGEGVTANVYTGATDGSASGNVGTELSGAVITHSLVAADGSRYIAVTPSSTATYNSVRINLNIPADVPVVDLVRYDLNVYYAFKSNDFTCGLATYADEGSATGVNLNVLNTPLVANPANAIDGNSTTFSQVSFGNLSVSVGSAVHQTFYYHGLSAPQDYFKVTLAIDGGVLNLGVLGNYEIKAYNGNEEVFSTMFQSALINNLDLLDLLQLGQPVTLTFGPGVAFDRISVGMNNLLGASLASSPLNIYSIERYGSGDSPLTCIDPDPLPTPDSTDPMLSVSDCEGTVIDFDHANFPYNAVDGNNDTYTTLEASSGLAVGIGAYDGFIELGFDQRTAGTTTYIRIDFDEEVLLGLLDGTVGQLLGGVVDNVLFGSHYFTVEAKNAGTPVLEAASNNGFFNQPVKIVQDKNGHYYVAVTPGAAYNSIRITESLGAILGLGEFRNMNVYHACMATGSDDCEQAFATYSESSGISLDLLGVAGAGVQNAHLAIDDDSEAVEDDNTYSEISIGAAGVDASVFQFVDFHTLSSPADYFKVKLGVDNGSTLDVQLLGNIEIRAYNGDELVYSQRLQNGMVAGLDVLGLLSTNNVVTIPIGPGREFDRVAIGLSTLVDLSLFNQPLRVYSVKRFTLDGTCPDPNPLPTPPVTESPFNDPDCGVALGEFENVNFAYNAVDGNHDTYAIVAAGSGVALGLGGYDGFIELSYDEPLAAREMSYVRIDLEDEELLDALVAGSLGEFIADLGGLLLFGNHYFDISVRDAANAEIYNASGIGGFGTDNVRIVQDKVGRYYIAFTADEAYQSVRITLRNTALLGLDATTTMNVYGMCRETEFDACEQATFTSFDGTGLSADILGVGGAGVTNPQYAIDDNNSNYAELSLGTAAIGTTIYQDIYYKTKAAATDNVRLRLQVPETLVNADILGAYRVYLFNGDEEVFDATISQGLINNLDLLGLLNTGGIVGIEFEPGVEYDRVRLELGSVAAVGVGSPVRLYGVYRISEDCPDPEFEQPPFEDCADVVISGEYVDDIQNLIDGNHNSYATIRSDAGLVIGIGAYSGHLELGYETEKPAGTTSYIRISYDEGILDALLGGSLGGFLGDLIEVGVLGNHYFNVIVKDGDGNELLTRTSLNGFADESANFDAQVRIVQDRIGRYYLAITPDADYQSIRLEDHTTALLGPLSSEGHLNVYGMCNTPVDEIDCAVPFSTSFAGTGLNVELLGTGAGVENAFWAIDENTSNFSTLSLGNLSLAGSIQQNIQLNKATAEHTAIRVRLQVGAGTLSTELLGALHIIGYLDNEEVYLADFEQAFVGVNVVDLLNNGEATDLTLAPGVAVDEIAVRLSSLLGIGVAPNVQLFHVLPDCEAPEFIGWKSFEIDGDPTLTSVSGGETVEYTIHVRNTGTIPMTGSIITDEIPDHTTLVASSISDGGTESDGVITWEGIDIPLNGEITVSFSVTVDENLTDVTEISNVALVKANEDDPGSETFPPVDNENPTDPDDSGDTGTDIPVDHTTDVTAWKGYTITDGTSTHSVSGGETVTYTIYIRNDSNQDLEGLIVEDDIPEGTTYISGGSSDGTTVTFTGINVAFGETVSVSFHVTVDEDLSAVTEISNVALVKTDETDPGTGTVPPNDPENPSEGPDPGATPGTPTVIPVDPIHDIDFNKIGFSNNTESNGKAEIGNEITYTLTVENTGNKTLTDIVITDNLPDDVTVVDDGGGTVGTGTLTFNIATLAVGATETFTFVVLVDDLTVGEDIVNTAEAAFTDADGDPTAEQAEHRMPTDCTTIDADNIDLEASADEICEGETVTLSATLVDVDITDPEFRWYTNPALTGSYQTGSSIDVSPDETTTYYVTIVADAYCFNTPAAAIEIVVNPLLSTPSITPNGPIEICDGEIATLTATVGADSYVWYLDGVEVIGETGNTLLAELAGAYTVAAVNAAGCVSGVSAPVVVAVTPRATASDLEVTGHEDAVCEGGVVSLMASSSTITNPVFNWYADAALTELVFTGANLVFNPAENITLYVTVQGDGICENALGETAVVDVVVNPIPDFTVEGSLNYSIEVGNSVDLPTITAPTATVTWYNHDGQEHADPNTTETFDTPGTYTYTAVITEPDHCTVTVSVIINVYAEGECPPVYNRVYATDASDYGVSNLLGIPLGGIDNPANAADDDINSYSELTEGVNALGLFGQTYQTLKWGTTITAGTPVSVKLGKQFSVASALGSLRIVAVDASGNTVSTVHNVEPNILDAAGGLNVYDYTFTPADGSGQAVPYAGVKVYYQGAVSLLQTARIYEAYYHEMGAVDCGDDDVLDVLHGVENPISGLGVANALIGVTDPENVVDGDDGTYAVMNNVGGVNAQTRLEVRYNAPGLAGDEVHIQLTDPGSLLSVTALGSFTIQPYLGDAPVGEPIVEDGTTLRIELLGGGSEAHVIYTADRPFDRIKILYGGVASVLDQLRVNEITRVIPLLELGDDGDNTFEICEGDDIVIPDPDDCTTYLIYDAITGGNLVDITELAAGVHALYVQTVRFGACEVGERTEIEVTVNALPVAPVVTDSEVCLTPDDVDVFYNVTPLDDHTLNYYESEAATTPLVDVPAVNSAVAGVYTVYVSQYHNDTGCEGPRVAVSITVVAVPAPALEELEQTFCEIDGATVADLNTAGADGEVIWYSAATGGTPLALDAVLTAGVYYAAQVGDNCESVDRTEVAVTITETPAPALEELEQIFCEIDGATVADLNTAGADGEVIWYSAATGGTPLALDAVLTTGVYYAAQVGDNCESVDRTEVAVTITETPAPALEELEQTFCETDGATMADLNTTGADGEVIWYSAATGGTPLAADAALVAGTYYAAQVGDNCESVDRTEVAVTITETPAPALEELEQTFCETDGATVADLNTAGVDGEVIWYSAATGGTPLALDAALTTGVYYAAQVGDNCESVDRTEVAVTITETPAPALEELEQTFCEIDGGTVADLNTTGADGEVIWYSAAAGGTPLAADAALVAGTYYAAQVGDNCESVDRTEVTVAITGTPAPTTDNASPEFCATDNMTLADLQVVGTDIKWYASAASTDVLPGTTLLEDGVTYYATQTGDDCESAERLAVTPVINDCAVLLSISKTADADRATAGESISFTLTITNEGPGAIQSGDVIQLGERPSNGLTITGYAVTSGNGTIDGNGNTAAITASEAIATGGTITITVTADVDADAPATITNGIDVWGPDKDPETDPKDDDDDTPPIPVDRESNLSITKVADEARVKAGESTTFTITVTNNGPSVIDIGKTINLTERPGDGVTITNYEITAGAATITANDNTAVLTTTGQVAVGGAIVLSVSADIDVDAPETITNGITVWGPDKDPETDPEDDEDDTPPIPVDREAILSITKAADDDRVVAGGSTSFTLTITNNGPAVIANGEVISLTERPSEGVTVTGYEVTSGNGTTAGTGNTATVTTSEAIAVGATIIVKVTADIDADAPETITNGISVWGPDKDPETEDPDDEDDTPEIPVDPSYLLSITKVADDARVISGGSTTFTVTVTNNGPSTIASGGVISLEERPSAGVTITGYEVTSGNATVSGSGNNATLTTTASMANGGTITLIVSADITAAAGGTITNGIAVWAPDKDPDTDEEDDVDQTPEIPVDAPHTLSIEKVGDQSLVTAGQSTTFTVTVTNNGPLPIGGGATIALEERPGAGVTITGYEILSGAATISGNGNEATVTTTGEIAVGSNIVVRITADVASTASGTITNGIAVWAPGKDPNADDPDDEDVAGPIPVDATLVIPNLFTPNGDGLNDQFVIKNLLQYQHRELLVLNRWGNQVYKSANYNNDWDGGTLGEGTYYYILRVRNGNGEWQTYKGAIAIIRVTNR